jgi:hypothetical protein
MTKDELIKRWHRTVRRCQVEHEISSRRYEKLNWKLGVPVVILSAIVGASIFGTLQKSGFEWVQVTAGFMSVTAVVLSSLQTFLGFGERASSHKTAADRFGELAKEIQQAMVCGIAEPELPQFLQSVRSRWDGIAREAPTLRQSTIVALAEDPEGVDPVDLQKLQSLA